MVQYINTNLQIANRRVKGKYQCNAFAHRFCGMADGNCGKWARRSESDVN